MKMNSRNLLLLPSLFLSVWMQAVAADQTITGNLTVTGDTTLSGGLVIAGIADFNDNVTNFGTNGANAATPGLVLTYADTSSGSISTIVFGTSGTTSTWRWDRNSVNGLIPQMALTSTNSILLWNPTNSTSVGITLNPAGTSTFASSIVVMGTNSLMPGQTLTGTASILTQGLGDNRYLTPTQAGATYVTTTQAGALYLPRSSTTYGLGTGVVITGTNQIVTGQYNDPAQSGFIDKMLWTTTDSVVVVGSGTDASNRSNALLVTKNGNTLVAGHLAVGKTLNVAGSAVFRSTVTVPQQGDLSMGEFTQGGLTSGEAIAQAYFDRLAAVGQSLSTQEKDNIANFLVGVDQILGIDNVVECWALRGTQNAGSGITLYGLLGKYNGTLVNNPTWAGDGINFVNASGQYITTSGLVRPGNNFAVFAVFNRGAQANSSCALCSWMGSSDTNAQGFMIVDANNFLIGMQGGTDLGRFYEGYLGVDGNSTYFNATFESFLMGVKSRNTIWRNSGITTVENTNYISGATSFVTTNPNASFVIGAAPAGGRCYQGKIAFMMILKNNVITYEGQIYQLYKVTLGQGLSLP